MVSDDEDEDYELDHGNVRRPTPPYSSDEEPISPRGPETVCQARSGTTKTSPP